jgi:hypothetical protein
MEATNAPLLYQLITTKRSRYPTWLIIDSFPLPVVIRCIDLGNDICSSLLSTQCALVIPSLLNSVAESLSWLLETALIPFAAWYQNVLKVVCLACFPDSNIYLFDTHLEIVLAAVADFVISGWNTRLARVLLDSQMHLLQCW